MARMRCCLATPLSCRVCVCVCVVCTLCNMPTWNAAYVRNCFKDSVGWIFLVSVVIAFVFLIIMKAVSPNRFASVEKNGVIDSILDSRCICVCPHNLNITNRHNRTVFMKEVRDPSNCTCMGTVFDADEVACLQCDCSFESRNVILIKTIVYSTLIVSFLLMPPCAFVVCIQPWIRIKILRTYTGPSLNNTRQSERSTSHMTRLRRSSQHNRLSETPT